MQMKFFVRVFHLFLDFRIPYKLQGEQKVTVHCNVYKRIAFDHSDTLYNLCKCIYFNRLFVMSITAFRLVAT